jgi:prevent-host-death family protein
MAISAKDIIPLSQARAALSDLADEVKAGAEKIITKNGESYIALIGADRLDHFHRLEKAWIHMQLLSKAEAGMADVAAGRTHDARAAIDSIKARRAARWGKEGSKDDGGSSESHD